MTVESYVVIPRLCFGFCIGDRNDFDPHLKYPRHIKITMYELC